MQWRIVVRKRVDVLLPLLLSRLWIVLDGGFGGVDDLGKFIKVAFGSRQLLTRLRLSLDTFDGLLNIFTFSHTETNDRKFTSICTTSASSLLFNSFA